MAEDIKEVGSGALAKRKRLPFLVDLLVRLVREKLLGTVGAAIFLLLLLVGIFANWLAPYGYNEVWVELKRVLQQRNSGWEQIMWDGTCSAVSSTGLASPCSLAWESVPSELFSMRL